MTSTRFSSPLATLLFLLTALLPCLPSFAQALDSNPDPDAIQSETVPASSLASFFPTGALTRDIKLNLVDLDAAAPADQALQVEVIEGKSAWDMGMVVKNQHAVTQGDVLLARFQMRCKKSMTGQGLANFIFQQGQPDWQKSAMVRVGAGSEWTQINLPFIAKGTYAKGQAMAGFHLSLADQILEIANFQVLNYGPDHDLKTLPNSDVAYEGRAPDAPWRAEAQQRIDALRKGALKITVLDANGQPLPDAKVNVEMTRHAFPFGSAFAVSRLLQSGADGERYREELQKNFNSGVFESALKWNNYGTGTPTQIGQALAWLGEHHITMRGHVLMWPSWRWISDEAKALKSDLPAMRKVLEERVTSMVTLYRDTLDDWDVVNEAYSNHDIMDLYGDEIMGDWFKLAREAHPDAVLYINDNDILTAGGRDTKHAVQFRQTIQDLIDAEAPVGGIGMQGHFATTLTAPQDVWKTLDRFAHFNLPIKVTEFDVNHQDAQLQADYQRDFLTAVFAHESVQGFVMWGFWAGQHWRPDAALFNQDWTLRKHGKAYRDLVYKDWWTVESGTTDANGTLAVRGFLGDYQITVTDADGNKHEAAATLGQSGQNVMVNVTPSAQTPTP